MARFDKYDPVSGGFRAALAASYTGAVAPVGVGLDANGRVVVGSGVTGIKGVICIPSDKPAGEVVDVMTHGEIVDLGGAAADNYTANTTTGAVTGAAASATQIYVGHTVEADRLIVRVNPEVL